MATSIEKSENEGETSLKEEDQFPESTQNEEFGKPTGFDNFANNNVQTTANNACNGSSGEEMKEYDSVNSPTEATEEIAIQVKKETISEIKTESKNIKEKDFVRDSKTGIVKMNESRKPVNQKITEKVNEENTEKNRGASP